MNNLRFFIWLLINPDRGFFSNEQLNGKVLNYGCGHRKDPMHIGVDIAENTMADYIVPEGEILPFPDNTFDIVISRFVLEHVSKLDPLLLEISRVLKPGGLFRFCVPHAFSIDAYDDPTHCRFFTLRSSNYFTGKSQVYYSVKLFTHSRQYLRLGLAWPNLRLIRYPLNFLIGSLGLFAPYLGEQLLKLPFINGTLFFELKKAPTSKILAHEKKTF